MHPGFVSGHQVVQFYPLYEEVHSRRYEASMGTVSPYGQVSEAETLVSAEKAVECRWGSSCGVNLTDLSAAGIAWHLKRHHFHRTTSSWNYRARGVCQWQLDSGHSCGTDLFHEGFGKHIASVHLKSISRICPRCGRKYCRVDALKRHLRESCIGFFVEA